jgi:hypothetical protein
MCDGFLNKKKKKSEVALTAHITTLKGNARMLDAPGSNPFTKRKKTHACNFLYNLFVFLLNLLPSVIKCTGFFIQLRS